MFDQHARDLIQQLPELPGLNREACRQALSAAYFHVVRIRLQAGSETLAEADLDQVRSLLRKMADALESAAVFDRLNGAPRESNVETACAFIAAEAIALLAELGSATPVVPSEPSIDVIRDARHYARIEAALLYMIGGYDINAAASVRGLPEYTPATGPESLIPASARNAAYLLSRIRALCRGDVRQAPGESPPYTGLPQQPALYEDILVEARLRCYELLARGANAYLQWLSGGDPAGLETARQYVRRVRRAALPERYRECAALADVHHLASLILVVIDRTNARSVLHHVPNPVNASANSLALFRAYLSRRVWGDSENCGRAFLWPSAQEFIQRCLPGPKCDAVVAMPTGSGKSFVAELAIVDALCRGSVIYLAPTNTLVHQIRRDLGNALEPMKDVRVLAFIGSGEYSGLLEDVLEEGQSARFVAVMTPEKCALALRLAPEAFRDLVLCVFDECHLLNDETRGITADILLAQLFAAAPAMRFVFMSAMITNPEELADWLHTARDTRSEPSVTKWRPSRTLRGLLAVHKPTALASAEAAAATLAKLQQSGAKRVNYSFDAEMALICGMSGPWTLDGSADYRITALSSSFEASVSIRNARPVPAFDGWKNAAAKTFAESLARAHIAVIAFILSSRHHAFSLASQITAALPGSPDASAPLPELIEAWLSISDAELGVATALRGLLRQGVAAHTSAMLQTEQAASEWMFHHRKAPLMFATPTLAQGLNLPAIGVVVAGTSMGDPREARETDRIAGVGGRAAATILNSFGRAGRPGFANQGVAVLVSDKPFFTTVAGPFDPSIPLSQYGVLGEADAAVQVRSPIEGFLDRVLAATDPFNTATEVELELTTLLAESPEADHSGRVLRRSFAGYRKRAVFTEQASEQIRARIAGLKQAFLQQPGLPPWLNTAAMKGGVDVFRAWRMWDAYLRRGVVSLDSGSALDVMQWLIAFLQTMSELPPRRVENYMAEEEIAPRPKAAKRPSRARVTVLTKFRDAAAGLLDQDTIPWRMPPQWRDLWEEVGSLVAAYLRGETYAELAHLLFDIALANVTSGRGTGQHIPAIFGLLRKVFEPLARDAGCFVALNEHAWQAEAGSAVISLPEALQALPLCIRYGCDSPATLGWFRFGYRQRACAHALARAFPVPVEIANDTERSEWIRDARRRWLAGHLVPAADPQGIVQHARTVILQAAD